MAWAWRWIGGIGIFSGIYGFPRYGLERVPRFRAKLEVPQNADSGESGFSGLDSLGPLDSLGFLVLGRSPGISGSLDRNWVFRFSEFLGLGFGGNYGFGVSERRFLIRKTIGMVSANQ